jgi:hypothetical protein
VYGQFPQETITMTRVMEDQAKSRYNVAALKTRLAEKLMNHTIDLHEDMSKADLKT